jgi:hypothetical protein
MKTYGCGTMAALPLDCIAKAALMLYCAFFIPYSFFFARKYDRIEAAERVIPAG